MSHSHRKRADEIMKAQWKAGWDAGVAATFKTIYPCILIAAKNAFGFAHVRGLRLLKAVDEIVTSGEFIDSEEAMQAVFDKYGIQLKFTSDDPLDMSIVKEKIE